MNWRLSHRADPYARDIADRHYNRQKIGTPQFVPPGRCLVLVSDSALWVTSWPYAEYVKHEWAGAWINSCFRNEGIVLSSALIIEAVAATRWRWSNVPPLGLISFVDASKVKAKRNPGYCYQMAGFALVGETKGGLLAWQSATGSDARPGPTGTGQRATVSDMTRPMFSILCPSRGRPANIARLYKSLKDTTVGEWELLVRLDVDDPTVFDYPRFVNITLVHGSHALMSTLWNDLIPYALGDILMLCGDDITFNTPGWDVAVREAFPPDQIALVHGNDLSPNSAQIATHPFVSRVWVETLGYLCPPFFSSDYNDLWLTDLADRLNRRIYLPEVITEHHHPSFDKAEWDQTHEDRRIRDRADNNAQIWEATFGRRLADRGRLLALIQ